MNRRFHDHRGSVLVYALILLTILSIFISNQKILILDHSLGHSMSLFEAQARQAAQSGLAICLRRGGVVNPPQMYSMNFSSGMISKVEIYYQLTGPAANSTASVTAIVYDQNNAPQAYRRAQQNINCATCWYLTGTWLRP